MAQVTPAQVSFNAGEVSGRLRARIDQSLYAIAVSEMIGFAPLVEGPAEAMPGTIHVDEAPGPFREVEFEYSTTQGHVLEFSHGLVRVFTNDALLTTLASPYTWAQVQELTFHQSFDVLYCFHPSLPLREFYRSGPSSFGFDIYTFTDGPFEPRNTDESVTVAASGVEGSVTLEASSGIFAATDEGSLFRLEATDFGDITAWEPYITVTAGQYLTANDRVYRVVGGGRTGTLTPVHTEGVEWDGIASGTDINDEPAGGVRLEYLHDRFGVLRIDEWVAANEVEATVLRRLPFSVTGGTSYEYTGGYYDPEYGVYVPPETTVSYGYGTHRWSFGRYSDTRGWPATGCVWNERLCLAKDSTIDGSVAGDLGSFAELNEAGEASNDMAFVAILKDANPIRHLVGEQRLLAMTAGGVHALGPASAAAGIGPGNVKAEKQHDAGAGAPMPVTLNSRVLHIDRSARRIYETDLDANRQVEAEMDLTRFARHIGNAGLVDLAVQQHPFNMLWVVTAAGELACAAYLPEERVLGFARRPLAPGLLARSICTITDPDGHFDQLWIGAEHEATGEWHQLRMAPWRLDGELEETPCMVDLAVLHEGEPETDFAYLLPGVTIHVVADGKFFEKVTDGAGAFELADPAEKVWFGLPFPASIESLDFEMGGEGGPARARKARFSRAWMEVINAQGLAFGVPGKMVAMEQLKGDSETDIGFPSYSGFAFREAVGTHTRHPRLRIERQAPFQSALAAWGGVLNMDQH